MVKSNHIESKRLSIKLIIILSFFIFLSNLSVWADYSNGKIYPFKQPDGKMVKIKVYGDEHYRRMESLDGYTLVQDPETKYICYAKLNNGIY